jgi:penicillin-binding protein 1C
MTLPARNALSFSLACVLPVLVWVSLLVIVPLPPAKPFSRVILDRQGRMLHAFLAADGRWRLQTQSAKIPHRLKTLLLAREDRWFYVHPGVNPLALARAALQNLRAGSIVSGGSTITMQIARMLEPGERTYLNKLREIFRALQLEWRYSKEELLGLYCSIVPLGGNIEGMESGALLYYRTPLERLHVAQIADLILIPSNPNRLRPDLFPGALLRLRRRETARWLRCGAIDRADSSTVWNLPAVARRQAPPRRAPHFSLRLRENPSPEVELRTTLDLEIQQRVEALLSAHSRQWKAEGVGSGAVIVLENHDAGVVAYAGSPDFSDEKSQGQVDAVRALRSPGSTLKPLLYAHAMDRGRLTPRRRLLDVPYDAEGFQAENYDGTYSGLVYAEDALRRSLNVPMVRLLQECGVSAFLESALEVGLHSLRDQQDHLGLSLILGGCGVRLEELTAAYASLPSGGLYRQPRFLLEDSRTPPRRVWSASAAAMVTDILSSLDRPDLPSGVQSALTLPVIAFKTGTSYGRRDAWTLAYTECYTVGVWMGNQDNAGSPELVGGRAAAPLAIAILNAISPPGAKTIMAAPPDLGVRMVCRESGQVPGPRCTDLVEDSYSRSASDRTPCTVCRELLVAPDRSVSYCSSCQGNHPAVAVTVRALDPLLSAFLQARGMPAERVPPHNPLCTRVFAGEGPAILSPLDGMTYYQTSAEQQIVFQASSSVDVRDHAWYLGDRYLGRWYAGERKFFPLLSGAHTLTCVDDHGRRSQIRFTVRRVL